MSGPLKKCKKKIEWDDGTIKTYDKKGSENILNFFCGLIVSFITLVLAFAFGII